MNKNPNVIAVTIPAQTFSSAVYGDNNNCYLATALKQKGYNVRVAGCGAVDMIKNDKAIVSYESLDEFNCLSVQKAFLAGKSIDVILLKV